MTTTPAMVPPRPPGLACRAGKGSPKEKVGGTTTDGVQLRILNGRGHARQLSSTSRSLPASFKAAGYISVGSLA